MNLPQRLQDLDEGGSRREEFLRLRDAKVLLADYTQIFADFPWLREGCSLQEAQTAADRWLLDNAAIVSKSQAVQTLVNSEIHVRGDGFVQGIRPPSHGRAAVLSASDLPINSPYEHHLINVKGVGVSDQSIPLFEKQKNGLIPLYCALYEFLMHKLVAAAFRHAGSVHRVLPAYAVIDAGYDEVELASSIARPAGLLVRRAHFRTKGGIDLARMGSARQLAVADAEFLLRHYGLTSCASSAWFRLEETNNGLQLYRAGCLDSHHTQEELRELHKMLGCKPCHEFDGINVQFTDNFQWGVQGLELVDLHYAVRSRFELPLVSTVCDRSLAWGGKIDPDHPDFVQPNPEILCDPVWLVREPTDEEIKRLKLNDRTPIEGGILTCIDAAASVRCKGRGAAEHLVELVERTIRRWPVKFVFDNKP